MLKVLEEVEFAGGKAHRVEEGVYHLIRGEIYSLNGRTFFAFGGGESRDRALRKEGKNWWSEEMPDATDYERALENLKMHNFSVDYIISHSAPTDAQRIIAPDYKINELTEFLQKVKSEVSYSHWYFGHYHKDEVLDKKHTAVFNKKILI